MAKDLRLVSVLSLYLEECLCLTVLFNMFIDLFLGDLIWMRLPGLSMLVVNDLDMAHDLLSKNPSLNSRRHIGYMMNEM
jgi:hypothetical protein